MAVGVLKAAQQYIRFMRMLVLLGPILGLSAMAQDCSIPFTESLFDVQVESDVWYGNASRFNGGTDSLRLNLYKPVGDGQTERPLVLLIHGGGFIEGHRHDFNALCAQLASYGWAAATVSYRLGYYGNGILDPPYAYDPNEFQRAAYRAMQDAKGALRFLKGRHLQDSTSISSVFLLGASAGAITAMHSAYLDLPAEKPASCGAIGQVQHFFNFYQRPDLGTVEGDLHLNGHDASALGVVNIFGAVLDTGFIVSAQDPALFSYHQINDPVVGCGTQRPYWGIGLGAPDQQPWIQGSCTIDQRVQNLGFAPERYQFILHNGNEHAVHDPVGVIALAAQWMRDLMCSITTSTMEQVGGSWRIVPNPASDGAILMHPMPAQGHFALLDAQGRTLRNGRLSGDRTWLQLHDLAPGAYWVRIEEGAEVTALRLVKD